MGSEQNFTEVEAESSTGESLRTLKRFVKELPLLRAALALSLLLTLVASILPQLFLWLSGLRVECTESSLDCSTSILGVGFTVSLALLTLMLALAILFRFLCWTCFEISAQLSMRSLHRRMIQSLARTRVTYFDQNPSGRLINRVVGDFDTVRNHGLARIIETLHNTVDVLCVAALVFVSNITGALLVLPTLGVLWYLQGCLSPMLRRIQNIHSIRKGEYLHRETDLIEGAAVFSLYGRESALGARLRAAVAHNAQMHLWEFRIDWWARFWVQSVSSAYTFIALICVAYSVHYGVVTATLAAVMIGAIGRLMPAFLWLSWSLIYLDASIVQIRRLFELVDLPEETKEEFATAQPHVSAAEQMPALLQGDLEFSNYRMAYRYDLPEILHGLTLTIPFGIRIGIIGRTGAGKSSLMQSLLRMVYVRGGEIRIAGHSLHELDINHARAHFAIVPQDPYLYAGTVRNNLDPDHLLSDAQVEFALTTVGFPFAASWSVREGGVNLSLGERQLLCLARAILNPAPYVIMDEPTSSVDPTTDQKIQQLLRTAFEGRTVLTIAHRLETLLDYDLVAELKDGQLLRLGPPAELLRG
jgi:ABC-type multidrug transport system fused ATPase/permease subunit